MIYSVVPRELQAELHAKLVEYYANTPGVTVIVDRRTGPDRRSGGSDFPAERRETRDRRRPRVTGTFASTDDVEL